MKTFDRGHVLNGLLGAATSQSLRWLSGNFLRRQEIERLILNILRISTRSLKDKEEQGT